MGSFEGVRCVVVPGTLRDVELLDLHGHGDGSPGTQLGINQLETEQISTHLNSILFLKLFQPKNGEAYVIFHIGFPTP